MSANASAKTSHSIHGSKIVFIRIFFKINLQNELSNRPKLKEAEQRDDAQRALKTRNFMIQYDEQLSVKFNILGNL